MRLKLHHSPRYCGTSAAKYSLPFKNYPPPCTGRTITGGPCPNKAAPMRDQATGGFGSHYHSIH